MESYRALYKVPAKSGKLRDEKRENALREQKKKREDTFFERRNIQQGQEPSTSAAPSPAKTSKKQETRREKLLRWKAEKDRLIAHQKLNEKKKPPFKVGVAHHAIDPQVELAAVHATTVKCTTSKKAAAESRTQAATKRKANAPSEAATSLAALSAPTAGPVRSAAYSGRVTRSRTAAATSQVPTGVKAHKVQPRIGAASSSKTTKPSNSGLATRSNAVRGTSNANLVKAVSKKAVKTSRPANEELETSFAPKNHKFKAPSSLTLPTTPLTLKRKTPGFKEASWPLMPGIGVLSQSPSEPSPKVSKTEKSVASQRRARLSRAVKEPTPKKQPNKGKSSDAESRLPEMPHSLRKSGSGVFVVTELHEPTTLQRNGVGFSSSTTGNKSQDTVSVCDSSSASQPRRSMSAKRRQSCRGKETSEKAESKETSSLTMSDDVPKVDTSDSDTKNTRRAKHSLSAKKRQSLRGKENVPEIGSEKVESEESFTLNISEVDDIEPIVVSSRRMSIHDPSPAVHISPEKLSNGMVPAQFSPFITSARGKDKYSIQKRRSSLIPVVPEVLPEEFAKTRQIEHFRNLLERESSRLLTLSALWEERRSEVPPAAQDKILGSVGQARLLVKDKFQQFRRLVDKFEDGDSEGKITVDDLTGFWEMMLLTVENIDKRFKELEDQRANNWEEQEPEKHVKKSTLVAPAASKLTKPRSQVQSRLKDLIEAARKQRQVNKQNKSSNASKDVTTFDGGFFKVESPKKVLSSPKPKLTSPAQRNSKPLPSTPHQFLRRSLLQKVLTNSAVRAQKSPTVSPLNNSLPLSPSPKVVVAQMRASELGRRMSMDSGNESFSLDPSSPTLKPEPTKSILKSAARRSMRVNTPRNRVVFEVLNRSENSSPGSPLLLSSVSTPPRLTPVSQRTTTPGNRKRASLIPRLIPTPKGDRPSLMPMRESLVPSKPLPNGELIDFDSPKRGSIV